MSDSTFSNPLSQLPRSSTLFQQPGHRDVDKTRNEDFVSGSSRCLIQQWQTCTVPLPHPRGLARPQNAFVRDRCQYQGLEDHQTTPLTLDAQSQPPRPVSHPRGLPLRSRGRSPVSTRSPPEIAAIQGQKVECRDSHTRQYAGSGHQSFHSRTAISSNAGAPNHALSIASSEDETPTTRQTMRSLLHIAVAAFPLSLTLFLYTMLGLVTAGLLAPFRLCFKTWPKFSTRLLDLLMPPLNIQRRCIYQQPVQLASSRSSSSSRTPLSSEESFDMPYTYTADLSSTRVITTHLLAPFVAFSIAACAWVMGTVWALGAMVSDEDAGDDRDEQRLAQKVVSWWAWWLNRSLKVEDVEARRTSRGRRREMVQQRGGIMFA